MPDRPTINRMVGTTTIFGKHGNDPSHDNLVLPSGKKIADSSLEEIRSVMAALGDDRDVRFTPKSGHWNSVAQCPLCAKSGH